MELLWQMKDFELYRGRTSTKLLAQALFQEKDPRTVWEGSLESSQNREDVVAVGAKDPHKRTGTFCIKI